MVVAFRTCFWWMIPTIVLANYGKMAKFPYLPLILFYFFVLSDISGSGYNCLWLTKIISLITITRLGDYRKRIPENDLVGAFIFISKHSHRQPGVSTGQIGDGCVQITETLVRRKSIFSTHESQLSQILIFFVGLMAQEG